MIFIKIVMWLSLFQSLYELLGTEAAGLEYGEACRDQLIMNAFLNVNRSDRPMRLNRLSPEGTVPGRVFLLDSLCFDARSSRYKFPSYLYFDGLKNHRAVSWDTLKQVKNQLTLTNDY